MRLVAGWLLASLTLLAPLDSLDHALARAVEARRVPTYDGAMRFMSYGAGGRTMLLAGLLGIALLDPAAGPATVRLMLVAAVPANLTVEALKRVVGRPRPDGGGGRSNSSFPSSHAANAFALAVILARRWPRVGWGFLLLATVVAWSRVYLHRHYLSDVVVGAAIGVVSAWWMARLFGEAGWAKGSRGGRAQRSMEAPPPL